MITATFDKDHNLIDVELNITCGGCGATLETRRQEDGSFVLASDHECPNKSTFSPYTLSWRRR
jgi:hypothetical protein